MSENPPPSKGRWVMWVIFWLIIACCLIGIFLT